MASLIEMVISLIFLMLLMFSACGLETEECPELRCKNRGPSIRFPFRLKGRHPPHCGYPGFDLSCSETKHTVLELPVSVKLFISKIDYKSQTLHVSDPTGCPESQLQFLNLSASPFRFGYDYHYSNYTFFNCSRANGDGWRMIPCLSDPAHQVIAMYYYYDGGLMVEDIVDFLPCTKMYNVLSIPYDIFERKNDMFLNWSTPECRHCEAQGMICGLKKNSSKLPETECSPKRGALQRRLVIAGAVVGSLFLVLAVIALCRVYRSNKLEKENQLKIKKFLEDYKTMRPTRYSYADIKRITNDFKEELGQGAYGTVFKGKLSNEIFVAVKVLNSSKGNGEDFLNEMGTMGRIHHVNVVRLVGFCADGFIRALAYEYLPNDSLQKFISSTDTKNHFLGWEKLQNIAIGIAKGIEYLHQGCDQRILHFDINPRNILLDHNFNPKISDFGLAKLCSKDQSAVSMTTARGTLGYIAPEVFSRNFGNVSYKSDVYSFGMLLLEMVGGRRIINDDVTTEDTGLVYYPEWIYNLLEQGEDLRIQIEKMDDAKIGKILAIVGLWCIQWHPMDRPSMKNVVQMLEGEGANLTFPPNPFASTGPKKSNASMPGTRRHQGMEVISELQQELDEISELE